MNNEFIESIVRNALPDDDGNYKKNIIDTNNDLRKLLNNIYPNDIENLYLLEDYLNYIKYNVNKINILQCRKLVRYTDEIMYILQCINQTSFQFLELMTMLSFRFPQYTNSYSILLNEYYKYSCYIHQLNRRVY
jgi:hypothetical protein